ncbi:DUF1266 domain-containing protein [Thermobifida cellulosilytica]|uniref:DUF1266 domain-containing protein n=1 Tax=Thermobifida cellulosilytica TB100 TaxID=665004 RepID=A0A147KMQ3_THECS|nr:DUF1266 domain-containing protein [Thermobifida cellulosilytica]KUP98539.1 hypothetical protein AC529_00915 [Thermobifida cellulosilytica TB100]
MFTAVAGVVGALAIGAWAVVSWASKRRLPWLMAPLALLTVVLVAAGLPGWSLLPTAALLVGTFAELVVGAYEAPALRTKDPDAPLSTERWAAAVAAPFRVALAEPWDVVVRPQLRSRYRRTFARELGVTDRAGLLAKIEGLWAELHAAPETDLVVDLRSGVARSRRSDGCQPEQTLVLTAEQVARLREVAGAREPADSVVVGAYQWWRAVYLVPLICGGATLDWLSPVETQGLLRRVAADLQRRFGGWSQLSAAFHAGFLLEQDGPAAAGADRMWAALGLLTTDPTSPWRLLPWDMPLDRVVVGERGEGREHRS